jgi:1-acyl-sn-glycerol-3-phosphate acyltransferase
LGQFHGSAFRLAQHVGAKICPLTISGNEHIPSRGSLVMHPGQIVISKLPSVTCEQYKELNAYRLKTRVRETIRKHLDAQCL